MNSGARSRVLPGGLKDLRSACGQNFCPQTIFRRRNNEGKILFYKRTQIGRLRMAPLNMVSARDIGDATGAPARGIIAEAAIAAPAGAGKLFAKFDTRILKSIVSTEPALPS